MLTDLVDDFVRSMQALGEQKDAGVVGFASGAAIWERGEEK